MPGFPLAAIGAGLGLFSENLQRQRQQQQQADLNRMLMQNYARQQQQQQDTDAALAAGFQALSSAGGQGDTGGDQGQGLSLPGSMYAPTPQGSGMSSGLGDLVKQYESGGNYNVGFGGADLSNAPLDASGFPQWAGKMGPQGISHAAGAYQFEPATWRSNAGPLGIHDFSPASQDRVFQAASHGGTDASPWAPYNAKLRAALASQGGAARPAMRPAVAAQPADDQSGGGVVTTQDLGDGANVITQELPDKPAAGRAAPQQPPESGGGLGQNVSPELHQAGQQAAQNTAGQIPPMVRGRMSIPALAQAIDKANPNLSPAVKGRALQMMSTLLAPDQRQEMQLLEMQMRQENAVALEKMREQFRQEHADDSKWTFITQPDGSIVRANKTSGAVEPTTMQGRTAPPDKGEMTEVAGKPYVRHGNELVPMHIQGSDEPVTGPVTKVGAGSKAAELPPEVQFPDKWEGMPNKPPPNVRSDIWQGAIEYVRTGKMPAMGFAPGARNQILAASPAAAHALGIDPAKVADLQAQYAGMRHGLIVGGGRAANIEFGISEANKAAPQVIQTSQAVPRTEFPPLNQFTNWLSEKSGDPNIVAFRDALNTYLNVYASTVSRTGRLTDAQQRHAYDLLSTSFNQGQIDRGIQQLNYEMQLMREAIPEATGQIEQLGTPPALARPTPPAPTPQQQNAAPTANEPTATNPQTGEKSVFRGGKWIPLQ